MGIFCPNRCNHSSTITSRESLVRFESIGKDYLTGIGIVVANGASGIYAIFSADCITEQYYLIRANLPYCANAGNEVFLAIRAHVAQMS